LLTAIGLTPGGSTTVHIYTQTVHRTTQLNTEQHNYIRRTTQFNTQNNTTKHRTTQTMHRTTQLTYTGQHI